MSLKNVSPTAEPVSKKKTNSLLTQKKKVQMKLRGTKAVKQKLSWLSPSGPGNNVASGAGQQQPDESWCESLNLHREPVALLMSQQVVAALMWTLEIKLETPISIIHLSSVNSFFSVFVLCSALSGNKRKECTFFYDQQRYSERLQR